MKDSKATTMRPPATHFDIRLSDVKVALPNGRDLFAIRELSIPHGTHLLIQGESGRGKTTLLHLIAGLLPASEGDVELGGTPLKSLNDNERCELRLKTIGVIFQKLNLIDHLTVAENVSLSLPQKSDQNNVRIQSAISQVNLNGRDHDRCSYLSLGEQQRVAVARILAQGPEIILADEPTSSLDEKNASSVFDSLVKASKGKTLIVVSHDLRMSSKFDRVIRFEELGR